MIFPTGRLRFRAALTYLCTRIQIAYGRKIKLPSFLRPPSCHIRRGQERRHARKAYKPILTEILAQNYSSLLDVGAGTGEMLRMLINARPEARYAGIDLAENMLKVAEEKLPLPGHSFDIIICNDSFHHYPNPATALAEFKRVLNPGGMLLISDYRMAFPLRQLMNLFIRYSQDGDVHIYSKGELRRLTQDAGFTHWTYKNIGNNAFIMTARKAGEIQ